MQEIETKILEVDVKDIVFRMGKLGAQKLKQGRLIVDWFGQSGASANAQPWYLRIRKMEGQKTELSWKSLPKVVGNTRQSKEINLEVDSFENVFEFFQAIGFENYAHQEKDRTSWKFEEWNFDLDQYPGMPAYLEIEGKSEEHVAQAIKLLGLEKHDSVAEGERKLIEERYGLDWLNMRF